MVTVLILHNLVSSIRTFRFLISFLLVFVLFLLSGILFNGRISICNADDHDALTENQQQLESNATHLNTLARATQTLYCPASRLQFISTGFDDHLPNKLSMNAFSLSRFENVSRFNPLFPEYNYLDWTFLIGIIMSFIALTLTFDAVTLEKESGTLRSILSNSVARRQFLIAKFVSAAIVLLILLTIGMLSHLILITIDHPDLLHWTAVPPILLVYCISLIYLSLFAGVGLFISTLSGRSAISLVFCLVFWVITVLVIPNLGGLIAQTFFPITPSRDVQERISLSTKDIENNAPGDVWSCFSSDLRLPCYGMRAEMNRKILENATSIRSAYHVEQIHQVAVSQSWIKISPTFLYQNTLAGIANTGVSRVFDFEHRVNDYRISLMSFIASKDIRDPKSPHLINPYDGYLFSSDPVDYREIPKFSYTEPQTDFLFRENILNIGILLFQEIILFMLTLMAFNRYDVR